jgi:hypothetical protein
MNDLSHFPLEKAYLCQDCNAVGNSATRCPACASEVVLCLATVLDRQTQVRPEATRGHSCYASMMA